MRNIYDENFAARKEAIDQELSILDINRRKLGNSSDYKKNQLRK